MTSAGLVATGAVYAVIGLVLGSPAMLATAALVAVAGLVAGFVGGRRHQRSRRHR